MTTTQTADPRRSAPPGSSVLRIRDFRYLFAAAVASTFGVEIGQLALPLVAIIALDAGAGQVGLLATFTTVAFLVIGLPSGALIDRLRKRPVMIAADLVRAALLGWVPLAWWLDLLAIEQLYAVALLVGAGTVFFDVAALSLLPHVVGRDRLVGANSALSGLRATAGVAGPAAGGGLVALLTAPLAVLANAVGFVASAVLLAGVRRPEPRLVRPDRPRLLPEIAEGVRYLAGHPVLRPIALQGALANLSIVVVTILMPLLFVRELALSGAAVGLFFAGGGAGVFLGATLARRVADRVGTGRTLWLLGLAVVPFGLVVPLAGTAIPVWAATAGWAVVTFKVGIDNVLLVTFRQRVTPDRLLGRVNATFRTALTGALAVGAGLAGLAGELLGIRPALWLGAAGLALVWVPIFCSGLRTMRDLPLPDPAQADPAQAEPAGR
ncbi:MAG: MFS transporter [Natronosporangium sp.]